MGKKSQAVIDLSLAASLAALELPSQTKGSHSSLYVCTHAPGPSAYRSDRANCRIDIALRSPPSYMVRSNQR